MSINVTVNGNPVCVRRSGMVLSDSEQIKKNERDRRRRLRLEQVRQQSKEISCKLLERAKNLAKRELEKLERDGKSEMRKLHDRKIMEIQRKYREDTDDIGLAHSAAVLQPDVDDVVRIAKRNNRATATVRGKEATQRSKDRSARRRDSPTIRQENLRQAREVENVRSAMVAKLQSEMCSTKENNEKEAHCRREDGIIADKRIRASPKRKKPPKLIGKKSPSKVASKSNIKIFGQQQKSKSPRRVAVEIHRGNKKSSKRLSTSVEGRKNNGPTAEVSVESITVCKTISVGTDKDDLQEPRKIIPTIKLTPSKADKVARYNPEDYEQKRSDSSGGGGSSSVSDDSSYFSDGCGEFVLPKRASKYDTTSSNKVRLYDHCTRQTNSYDQPHGLVERIDTSNEPNATDAARQIVQGANLAVTSLEGERFAAQRRGNDALLREQVRRDYEAMINRNIDDTIGDERVSKWSRCCTNQRAIELEKKARERTTEDDISERPEPYEHLERVVKCSRRDDRRGTNICPESTSRETSIVERTDKCRDRDEIMSRQEHVLEMLKKVERQKRLLLREFGADLPNTIFNASITPLFVDDDNHRIDTHRDSPTEIKIINMSSSDENTNKTSKKKGKKKTMEMAVQTWSNLNEAIGERGNDKSVQVEMITREGVEEVKGERRENDDNDQRIIVEKKGSREYVEPRVTVITPWVHDSSSGSSVSQGIVIELENQQVKVTPKKKKSSLEKRPKRAGSCGARAKPRSLPSSVVGSPIKRYVNCATSAPSSRSASPNKINLSSEKIFDIAADNEGARENSSARFEENSVASPANGKPYRIYKYPTFKKVQSAEIRDASDTSTSYASLPPGKTTIKSSNRRPDGITPILEMLDSSENESARAARINPSPVSTPETPSPRIINVPSNVPHPERIGRILNYGASRIEPLELTSTNQRQRSSTNDPSSRSRRSRDWTVVDSRRNSNYCSCANPTCALLYDNIDDIREYAMTNHPEVLDKYEDLRNNCTERIASLTELIRRVRNDQQRSGMEFSATNPADETSLMRIPPRRPIRSDFQSVQRLVESIEAIHIKLAKTLLESQKIITNESGRDTAKTRTNRVTPSPISYDTKSKDSSEEMPMKKGKPIVIANEPVQIDIDRLKRGPYTAMFVTTPAENPPWPSTPRRHEEIVAKLYQEILEQSKTVDNSTAERNDNSARSDCEGSALTRQRTPSPPTNLEAPAQITEEEVTKEILESTIRKSKKDEEFVPLLAGIPKIPRALPGVQPVNRTRPPPAGGPYRSEINSSRHELSTIVEFDTPDTANRSQGSTKSPSGKYRRTRSPSESTSTEKNSNARTLALVKPSVNVAPLMSQRVLRYSPRGGDGDGGGDDDVDDVNGEKLVFQLNNDNRPVSECPTTKSLLSQGSNNLMDGSASRRKDDDGKSLVNERAERDVTVQRDKLTSTSSNSFSGLSGISEIISSPTSELMVKWASSSEEIETALKKMGLGWAIVTLKKTREASALSSSSNSDLAPTNTARRTKSPNNKKQINDDPCGLPDFSDVSSISIKEASKSTERAVLMKARTSTPNIQNSNSTSEKSTSVTTSASGISIHSDSLTAPNLSLANNIRS